MTAKEKSQELIEKFRATGISFWEAKQCALIAVEEIINIVPFRDHNIKMDFENTYREPDWLFQTYWNEVKQEIEKL